MPFLQTDLVEMKSTSTRKLSVVHVTLGLDMGGLEKLLVEFARHADRNRFELRFVSLTTRGTLADHIEAAGWPVTVLNAPSGFRPRVALDLATLFQRWQIDVVHTHDDRPCIYGAPAARLAGARTVIHSRHGRSPLLTRRQRLLVRMAARLTDRFVCVSNDSAVLSVRQGISRRRVRTIWNGIDLARFTYAGPCTRGPVVAVARLSPEKGIDNLIRAIGIAAKDCPSIRAEIAGDGPCWPDLMALRQQLGLADRIRLLGQVTDVPAVLGRAGIFVLPSLSEGISLTLLEAMARGLPVVAAAVGGTCEAVQPDKTGLLVPAGNPSALAAALVQVMSDPTAAHAMGLAGRRRVETLFDVRRMVADYESLYQCHGAANRSRWAASSLLSLLSENSRRSCTSSS
jgi:glycosyltransferase involved in cell wall biosynthesis